ncbi:MAG: Gfo/Idh/MocA family oxidoreductase [Gemmatimonadetes bacterium]|nr:Gfo/Idh/MocA family oxidoreductase [Gemmatimonadota bacterium]
MSGGAALPIGVIGVGSLGFHHARILRDMKGTEMVGVYDANPTRAAEVAAQLGVTAFASVEALLTVAEAAVVAVPTTVHERVALQAIERGVHLLIEKPLASTLEEADRILQAAGSQGLLIATGHVERYNSALRAAEQYLDRPLFIESHRLAPFGPRGTDVAVVLDLMIHDIDLVLSVAGREVLHVDAVGVPVLTPMVDIANARIRFEGGAAANITASRVSRERMRKIRFFQRSGYISLDFETGTGEYLRLRRGAKPLELGGPIASLEDIVERIELHGDGREPLRCELEAFVSAVRGEPALIVSGQDGRRALAVALDIVQRTENVADSHTA